MAWPKERREEEGGGGEREKNCEVVGTSLFLHTDSAARACQDVDDTRRESRLDSQLCKLQSS